MTQGNSDNRQITCPACDYDRGKPGRPQVTGDHVRCLDCGATWRELGSKAPMLKDDRISERVNPFVDTNDKSKTFRSLLPEDATIEASQTGYNMRESNRSALYLSGIAGLVFLSCLAASVFILQSLGAHDVDRMITSSVGVSEMRISNIKVTEMVRQGGRKIFRVEGEIENPTKRKKPLPRLLLILKNDRGSELLRWHYSSPVKQMDAGRKLRFASTVQYDTPYAASAEAYFE